MEFGRGVLYRQLSSKLGFRDNRRRDNNGGFLAYINEYLPCIWYLLADFGEIWHKGVFNQV